MNLTGKVFRVVIMNQSPNINIGISGRVFNTEEPGGDAGIGIEHAKYIHNNHKSTIIYSSRNAVNNLGDIPINYTGYVSDSPIFGLVWEQLILPILCKNDGIDLLYSPNSYCPIVPTKFPKVIAIQDIPSYHGFGAKNYRRFRKAFLPVVARATNHIITVSEYTKKDIVKHLPISKENVSVVYNAIDDIYFSDDCKEPEFDVPDRYLLYTGAKSERKNLSGILSAFERLQQTEYNDYKLIIVGPDENTTYSRMKIEGESVISPGYLTKLELKYLYENADVFVFPSRHESFGLPLIEAAACGTPIVTTRCGAIPEVIGSGAEYVDPDDSDSIKNGILSVLDHKCYSTMLSSRAEKRADSFRWENQGPKLIQTLENIHDK
jgi:glycosyltransferase involved in cell wall biosynthesis